MIVTYFGKSLVKIQAGDFVIAINPHAGSGGRKAPKFGASLVLSSLPDTDHGEVENMSYGAKTPFVVDGPGEYEIGGVYVLGVHTDTKKGVSKNLKFMNNTAFTVYVDGIRFCHLGAQQKAELDPKVREEFGEIDVLFIPVSGGEVLEAKDAHRLVTALEPKIVIPLSYEEGKKAESSIAEYLKESGESNGKPEEKFVFKKKDIELKEGEVVILAPQ